MSTSCFLPELANELANDLLAIDGIKLSPDQPFKWASGWNSPIYCDNRISLSFPVVRKKITKAFCAFVESKLPDIDVIAGVATAGIPQAAIVAHELGLPMVYVRPQPKSHGLKSQIEGFFTEGQKIILIEDLISTGNSSLKAVQALRGNAGIIDHILSIFTYGFDDSDQLLSKNGIDLVYLSNYSYLLEVALKKAIIDKETLMLLKKWRKNPATWFRESQLGN